MFLVHKCWCGGFGVGGVGVGVDVGVAVGVDVGAAVLAKWCSLHSLVYSAFII